MNLSPAELFGYCVACGELEGHKFSWDSMGWVKPAV